MNTNETFKTFKPARCSNKQYIRNTGDYVTEQQNKLEIENSKTISAILYYFVIILLYGAIIVFVAAMRLVDDSYTPPDGKYLFVPTKEPSFNPVPFNLSTTEYRADVAHEYLRYLARAPHPWGTAENIENVDYLSAALNNLKQLAEKNGVKMEIIERDPTIVSTIDTRKVKDYNTTKKLNNATSSYVEGGNVLARIIGLNGSKDNSILLSSHLDSQLVSPGATDDGINGGVMLEIARHIIFNRLKSTIVFNFNNGEEIGLKGALGFMHHPWSKTVKSFINIEGAGAGGKALVFRASNLDQINYYSEKTNGYITKWQPHANVFANDAFKLGLINSDTDYTVYASYGIPGLDIAFYERRSVYHTASDSVENVPIGSIQQVGAVVLNTIKAMSDDQAFMNSPRGETDGIAVYYDILGRFMVNHSFKVMNIIYSVLLATIILGTLITRFTSKRYISACNRNLINDTNIKSTYISSTELLRSSKVALLAGILSLTISFKVTNIVYIVIFSIIADRIISTKFGSHRPLLTQRDIKTSTPGVKSIYIPTMVLVRGCLFTSLASIVSFGISFLIGLLLSNVNFFIIYGHMFTVLCTHAFGNLVGIGFVLYFWMVIEGRIKGNTFLHNRFIFSRVATYSQLFIWWVAMFGGLLLATLKGAGILYYTTYFGFFSILASAWACFIEPRTAKSGFTRFISWCFKLVLAIAIPLIICFDITGTLAHGMAQTVIDGTGPIVVHMMFGLFTTASTIILIPFLATPGKKHLGRLLVVFTLVFIGFVLACCFIKPFTKHSPSHVYFFGDLNMDTKIENTTILANEEFPNVYDAINKRFPENTQEYGLSESTKTEKYKGVWIGNSKFAKSFSDSGTAFPSYKVTKNIPDNFPGTTLNRKNGALITISAPRSYSCMLTAEKTHAYSYVLHQYGISNSVDNYNLTFTPSNITGTIFPPETAIFASFDHSNVPEGCCKSVRMLTRKTDSKWIVYFEHYGDGFGDIELKCYYSEINTFIPPLSVINSTIVGTEQTLGKPHAELGLLSLTRNIEIN
ncbi:hypothetical protein BB559_002678 [Furculomyces boomerangus]|uniref:Peptide hydrolase n=1 Tax=Furculomyces boomerangus TaxID=61424 RepID=A0A2T9YTD3_9FUNG|nr:hypothetical protein BB559_002678 [Furculomyces boomerangus]